MVLIASRLRELLNYEPATGRFTRIVAQSNRSRVGDPVGSINKSDGFLYACVDGKCYALHRLAYLYMVGQWPPDQITHINDVRSDNRWENLRQTTKQENLSARAEAYRATVRHGLPDCEAKAAQIVRELFDHSAESGDLLWKAKPTKYTNVRLGDRFGTVKPTGYVAGNIFGKSYQAHRVIWLHVTGCWPRGEIDHVNGDRSDNRLSNIRDVDRAMNSQNRRAESRHSKAGLLGVVSVGGRFIAQIKRDGVTHRLGSFGTAQAAHGAYVAAKRRLHDGCTI